ncbi:visual system homeobox 1-like [Nannospalax galili]|uniref:visual system homeobox 1-like n=1 Tax=Nannospalax galili TaxID=1026970 RepID=UPI000819DD6A|nr:visual system homeobox 1-like [Nannospalax galili]
MTGRDGLSDGCSRSRALVPGRPTTSRLRSFAITDLLGLEADPPARTGPGLGSSCEAPAAAAGPGFCDSCPARRALPLGLGLLCGFGAQPPSAARGRCLLLADLPLLPPAGSEPAAAQAPRLPPPVLCSQQRRESFSMSGNQDALPAPILASARSTWVALGYPSGHPRSRGPGSQTEPSQDRTTRASAPPALAGLQPWPLLPRGIPVGGGDGHLGSDGTL